MKPAGCPKNDSIHFSKRKCIETDMCNFLPSGLKCYAHVLHNTLYREGHFTLHLPSFTCFFSGTFLKLGIDSEMKQIYRRMLVSTYLVYCCCITYPIQIYILKLLDNSCSKLMEQMIDSYCSNHCTIFNIFYFHRNKQ